MKLKVVDCERLNDNTFNCNALIPMLLRLSHNTDVFIQSGTYILNMSYTLKDLNHIQIRSNASKPAVIMCHNNSDFDTGIAFLRVSDLIIDHLSIVGVD